jgi:hypothetical protein
MRTNQRIDDALLGRIVERLGLLDVAARADAGLLARSGLVEQGPEGIALTAVGGELIGGRKDGEIRLRNSQQEILLRAAETSLSPSEHGVRGQCPRTASDT